MYDEDQTGEGYREKDVCDDTSLGGRGPKCRRSSAVGVRCFSMQRESVHLCASGSIVKLSGRLGLVSLHYSLCRRRAI